MNPFIHQAELFIKKHASTILTVAGGVGAVATTVTAVHATPKAMRKIDKAKADKGDDLTKMEIIQVAGPTYIPALLTGVASLACIAGANILNKREQAALVSAYALLDRSYKEYKDKVKELFDNETDAEIREEIARDNYDENDIQNAEDEDTELFYDEFTKQYFNSTKYKVQQAEYYLNRDLTMCGWARLNDYCEYMGIDPIESGEALGWSEGGNLARYWQNWIDFTHSKVVLEDGLECYIISMFQEPYLDFEGY